jgi:tRNA pseudouridine32 synthase/23S rRNA pseudouridine746 synthase/23S rRNA pseudouridine1911/1915/1917 synthase
MTSRPHRPATKQRPEHSPTESGKNSGRGRGRDKRRSKDKSPPVPQSGKDQDLLLNRLLYRDGLILIIDKPAGLPVHAGPGGGANVEQYLDALRFGLPALPALAHRLDRDTSGCLVLGRHRKALRKLGLLFSSGQVDKTYWAIVEGTPKESSGTIDMPLKKLTLQKGWRMVVAADGQPSITDYRVMGSNGQISWLELKPRTGRTHQIRVHCTEIGCPLIGDPAYGPQTQRNRAENIPLHLLARSIRLPLYPNREPVHAEAPPPPHMLAALRQCGYIAPGNIVPASDLTDAQSPDTRTE